MQSFKHLAVWLLVFGIVTICSVAEEAVGELFRPVEMRSRTIVNPGDFVKTYNMTALHEQNRTIDPTLNWNLNVVGAYVTPVPTKVPEWKKTYITEAPTEARRRPMKVVNGEVVKPSAQGNTQKGGQKVAGTSSQKVTPKGGQKVTPKGGQKVTPKGGQKSTKTSDQKATQQVDPKVTQKGGQKVTQKGGQKVTPKGGQKVTPKGGQKVTPKGGQKVTKTSDQKATETSDPKVTQQEVKQAPKTSGQKVTRKGGQKG